MSIFATVIPLCSEAISSSTGATILHGPHQDAQKSTSTGLSLLSTSSANDWSVTVTVDLSAMSSPVCGIWGESQDLVPYPPPTNSAATCACTSTACSASQRSASIAAEQPVPAAVT